MTALNHGQRWVLKDDEYLAAQAGMGSADEIGEVLGRTKQAVWARANKLGISLAKRRHVLAERFFTAPISIEAAYWMGALWADGHLISNSGKEYSITLEINKCDRQWLEMFKEDVRSDSPVREMPSHNSVRLCLYSKIMTANLIQLGLLPGNRAGIQGPPVDMPVQYISHFVRGFFDGDGSVYKTHHGVQISFVSSGIMCRWLQDLMASNLNIPCGIYSKQGNCSEIRLCTVPRAKVLIAWMYSSATRYLPRKRDKCVQLGLLAPSGHTIKSRIRGVTRTRICQVRFDTV